MCRSRFLQECHNLFPAMFYLKNMTRIRPLNASELVKRQIFLALLGVWRPTKHPKESFKLLNYNLQVHLSSWDCKLFRIYSVLPLPPMMFSSQSLTLIAKLSSSMLLVEPSHFWKTNVHPSLSTWICAKWNNSNSMHEGFKTIFK